MWNLTRLINYVKNLPKNVANFPKKIKNMSMDTIKKRVNKMLEYRNEFEKDIENVHVKLQQGNSKTGKSVYTVSLIPIADCCHNCKECKKECYDIINVCYQPKVQIDRARNSAVHRLDIKRFWEEVSIGIKYNCVNALRLNVGGDICKEDLPYINKVAEENPKCDILFFTKNYEAVNEFLDENEFKSNIQCIFSAWKDTPMDNRHNLPVSHVLYIDGSTTAPGYGSHYCQGNCSHCHYNEEGCFKLQNGESVIFPAH